jgi:predicted metal-dependent phosphotriesterase family hydrolase
MRARVLGTDTSLHGFRYVGINSPAEAFKFFIETLMEKGLIETEVEKMIKDNPKNLLNLDDTS